MQKNLSITSCSIFGPFSDEYTCISNFSQQYLLIKSKSFVAHTSLVDSVDIFDGLGGAVEDGKC